MKKNKAKPKTQLPGFVRYEIKPGKIKSADAILEEIAETNPEGAEQIKNALLNYLKGQ